MHREHRRWRWLQNEAISPKTPIGEINFRSATAATAEEDREEEEKLMCAQNNDKTCAALLLVAVGVGSLSQGR